MIRQLLVIGSLAFLACTCDRSGGLDAGAPDAGPPVLAEREPNDSAEKAMAIDHTVRVDANLGADPAHPDADWYAFTSALPRTVDLSVSCPPGADIALELVDETGTVLGAINAGGVGASEHFPNLDVSGRALARVVSLKRGVGGAYTLTARFGDRVPEFELEPNDRRVDATHIALGQAISGFISHPNDVDVFRYELPSSGPRPEDVPDAAVAVGGDDEDGGTTAPADAGPLIEAPARGALRIEVSGIEGVAFEVQVMTEAEAVLFAAKSREGGPLSLRNVGVRSVDDVIFVVLRSTPTGSGKDAKRGANDSLSYTLTVAQEDPGSSAEIEPNDDPLHATALSPNSFKEGFLSPRGDVDYHRLVVDGPSIVNMHLSGVEKLDLVLTLVSDVEGKAEEVLLRANEGGTREPEMLNGVGCSRSCLFKIEAAARRIDGKWVKDDENADSPYRLSAAVTPDDGTVEREPNDTAAAATPIALGRSLRGTVFPKKDVDLFRLDLGDRQVKTPLKATVTGVLKVDIGLYLHRLEADGKLTLVQTSDRAKGDRPETIRFAAEPGVYFIEVRDSRSREANFQDSYQLSVDEEGE
jgi:hypothetical protein